MAEKYLMILEVSQKQSFIFQSKRLRDNIAASDLIQKVTSAEYFKRICPEKFSEDNLVYSGGGHTILEFPAYQMAVDFAASVTYSVRKTYQKLELFSKITKFDESLSPSQNVKGLIQQLERKKSLRKGVFSQGTFGIEALSSNGKEKTEQVLEQSEFDKRIQEAISPNRPVNSFSSLGGSKNDSNFIAVVHIDGNRMGKRVTDLYSILDQDQKENPESCWLSFKKNMREFSEGIMRDYEDAYVEMLKEVVKALDDGRLSELSLKDHAFPVRRVITAGDDICFVTEGRIGIECAVICLKKLWQLKNKKDQQHYPACAGVAIVHQKYPFYKAYQLAEALCSNAKRMGNELMTSLGKAEADASLIDWHIEYGEAKATLSETKKQYATADGGYMDLRPYLVCADERLMQAERYRQYDKFKAYLTTLMRGDQAARSKIKQMRSVLRKGETAASYYIESNQIYDLVLKGYDCFQKEICTDKIGQGKAERRSIFVTTADGCKHSLCYDAIEIMDCFLPVELKGGCHEGKN